MKIRSLIASFSINTTLFFLFFFGHCFFIKNAGINLSFDLLTIYLYFYLGNVIASLIYFAVFKISPDSIGYLFLTLVMVKLGLFMLLFNKSLFQAKVLSMTDKFSILMPLALFLVVESILLSNSLQIKEKR